MTVGRLFGIAAAATALLFIIMALHAKALDPPVPAIQLTYRAESFHAILAQWGAEGVKRFKTHLFIDYPLMCAYGAFGYLYAARFPLSRPGSGLVHRSFPWLLPAAAAMDGVENALHLYVLGARAPVTQLLYAIAGVTATAKWGLILAFGIVAAVQFGTRRKP